MEARRSVYREMTLGLMQMLRETDAVKRKELLENMKIEEVQKQRVAIVTNDKGEEQLCIFRPTSKQRANAVLLPPHDACVERGMKKSDFTLTYYNLSRQHYLNIISEKTRNKVKRDMIITAALLLDPPMSVDDLEHALMETEHSGLFTNTYLYKHNIRNYILHQILDYSHTHSLPDGIDGWLEFTRAILRYLDLKPLQGIVGDASCLSEEEEALARLWLTEAELQCRRVNYMTRRKEYLKRYARCGSYTKKEAIVKLADDTPMSQDSSKALFDNDDHVVGTKGSHGERRTLICAAIALGCTLDETNLLLQEADHAMVYPFRDDKTKLSLISRLLDNELIREAAHG